MSIKMACFDQDGCFNNNKYQVSNNGIVSKTFYTRDFWAIEQLQKNNIQVMIISGNNDGCMMAQYARLPKRCKSNLCVVMDIENKKEYMDKVLRDMNLTWNDVAYMGDAQNDLECIKNACFTCCPKDAVPEVQAEVDYVSEYKGGDGCIYDFAMEILKLCMMSSIRVILIKS